MYQVDNHSGTIYEKVFNTMALTNFIYFLSEVSDNDTIGNLWDNPLKDPKNRLKTILEELDKSKETIFKDIYSYGIYPSYLSLPETLDLYKQTLKFLYSNECSVPDTEIEYCIAKSLRDEKLISCVYENGKFLDIEGLKKELSTWFKDYGFSKSEIEELKTFIDKQYQELLNMKINEFGYEESEAIQSALEDVITMFTGEGLIDECFYDVDYELIDDEPEYAKMAFSKKSSLDDILSASKSKTLQQEKNENYIENENVK